MAHLVQWRQSKAAYSVQILTCSVCCRLSVYDLTMLKLWQLYWKEHNYNMLKHRSMYKTDIFNSNMRCSVTFPQNHHYGPHILASTACAWNMLLQMKSISAFCNHRHTAHWLLHHSHSDSPSCNLSRPQTVAAWEGARSDCLEDGGQLLTCTHCAIVPVISHAVEECALHVEECLLILRHLVECWLQRECHSFCNIWM